MAPAQSKISSINVRTYRTTAMRMKVPELVTCVFDDDAMVRGEAPILLLGLERDKCDKSELYQADFSLMALSNTHKCVKKVTFIMRNGHITSINPNKMADASELETYDMFFMVGLYLEFSDEIEMWKATLKMYDRGLEGSNDPSQYGIESVYITLRDNVVLSFDNRRQAWLSNKDTDELESTVSRTLPAPLPTKMPKRCFAMDKLQHATDVVAVKKPVEKEVEAVPDTAVAQNLGKGGIVLAEYVLCQSTVVIVC